MNATSTPSPLTVSNDAVSRDIDASCRAPLFFLFPSAAFWLVVFSVFGLIASIKFHSPNFLADCAWFTYGRAYAVARAALLYGFAVQAGLGVALWIVAQLGRVRVAQPGMIAFGGALWNLGLLVGAIGILSGNSTGFENVEMPRYAAVILFLGYLVMGLWIVFTLHGRSERAMEPSQWFILAALFWFAWIFSTAYLLLTVWPVRGVTQAVIAWWYSANLQYVWFAFVGLATSFFFLQRLTNRVLYSQYLALFTFWTIVLFASWTGVPPSAPAPAWIPALSTVATVMMVIPLISVVANVYNTARGCKQTDNPPPGKFVTFGIAAFVLAWAMKSASALPEISRVTNFTWYMTAETHLNVYGFFAMTMFGAIYYIVPRIAGPGPTRPASGRAHYWLAAIGIVLLVLPLAVGGILQGIRLNHPPADFINVTLHFLRVTSIGEVLLLIGHLMFAGYLAGVTVRFVRGQLSPVYADVTAPVQPIEVKR